MRKKNDKRKYRPKEGLARNRRRIRLMWEQPPTRRKVRKQ
jgi:hypothetical protein